MTLLFTTGLYIYFYELMVLFSLTMRTRKVHQGAALTIALTNLIVQTSKKND